MIHAVKGIQQKRPLTFAPLRLVGPSSESCSQVCTSDLPSVGMYSGPFFSGEYSAMSFFYC